METDCPGAADRLPGESGKAYEAFLAYLELGASRSNAKVGRQLGKSVSLMDRWSSTWRWGARTGEAESARARELETRLRQSTTEVAIRHLETGGRLAALAFAQLVEKYGERLADGGFAHELRPQDAVRLLAVAADIARRAVGLGDRPEPISTHVATIEDVRERLLARLMALRAAAEAEREPVEE